MKKLLLGVVEFHEKVLPSMKEKFAQWARGQSPDALMIACSDSRVAPNLFASTDPGDLFVVRNTGNMVPPLIPNHQALNTESEAAALEVALEKLKVKDIIICVHSRCAGMTALLHHKGQKEGLPHLRQWIRHGVQAKETFDAGRALDPSLSPEDQISQLNVLAQIENLKTYPQVKDLLAQQSLRIHGWWFDIVAGDVYNFDEEENRFIIIDQIYAEKILRKLK
jgi:carbonic anhydrase